MRTWPISLALIVLLGCSLNTGCDKDGNNNADDLVGTWLRVKTIDVVNAVRKDTWTLTFNNDGTFLLLYQHTENENETPVTPVASRQGLYSVDGNGIITIEGDWLDMASDVTSLDDLDGHFFTFTQETMMLHDKTRDLLFFGPDFHNGSTYTQDQQGNSRDGYSLLMNVGGSIYRREAHMLLSEGTDATANVVEQRDESYEYQITGADTCEGTYSYTITLAATTNTSEGTMQGCTYTHNTNIMVEAFGGGQTPVDEVTFSYTMDGTAANDTFISLGEHYLSYYMGEQATAIVEAAFVRIE